MDTHDYKGTLNLPRTSFPMKASLSLREPELLAFWERERVYEKALANRKGGRPFILHDGPPYANGDIHMGHALNKLLKDMVVKYKTMRGFYSPFVPGWDCHGLPVEHQLMKELKVRKHQIDRARFREKARDYALRFVDVQREQFKRLGIFGDWERPYLTLDPAYQAAIIGCFGRMYLDGYVYRGMKPIHWCPACETALAEAEVEYDDHTSPSVYVAFEAVSGIEKALPGARGASLLIWTTTPWTLPANRAVAVRPEFEYAAVRMKGRLLVVARELAGRVADELGEPAPEVMGVCRGRDLEGAVAAHPLTGDGSPVVLSNHVTLEQGTGLVHIAPGHGDEDYQIGLKYGLEIFAPVDGRGAFTKAAGRFAGMRVEEANRPIVDELRGSGALLLSREIAHSYPHCWRCRRPVIFRATEQWFIGVDRRDLRRRALEEAEKTAWIPERGRGRIASMLESRPDWCLSRQRHWGVPIPVLYCAGCGEPVLTAQTLARVREAVAARGADAWFSEPAVSFVPERFGCPSCGKGEFRKEEDIIDVWFDSGVSHQAVLAARPELGFPAALYLEGSDQHRGWFQTSLLTAVALAGRAPFATVLTHGFITDGEGKKMSKSAGNVIAPRSVIERYGADILRLWVASVDYGVDVRISREILDQLVDAYRRLRNTFRYLLGNLCDFSPERHRVPLERMEETDRWILSRLERLRSGVTDAYERYDFCRAYHLLHQFCAVDLSSLYLDVLKDRLYTAGGDSPRRRSAQTALCAVLETLVPLSAPILAFTAEEAWRAAPFLTARAASVHWADWPAAREEHLDAALEAEWERLLEVRREAAKALEEARRGGMIGNALEARVAIVCGDEGLFRLLDAKRPLLADLFIVSGVALSFDPSAGAAAKVTVARAEGGKCGRCWRYATNVGRSAAHPSLCGRCVEVLQSYGRA
ncbi:MAG: isoleucine--tRNA ligase [Candidatus Aureabacteria bacterium]|nr:isoleucine--tRNA ligase [Candidatus Auribacterota bacterium]NLW95074.1 isoleucine--tRNA ligase [Chlamydiota bacterium]HOE26194.1 isoleucine--tRNA ligase [bacterium]